MAEFGLWMLESSLLVLMILGIRKAFTGKISYAAGLCVMAGGSTALSGAGHYYSDLWHRYNGIRCGVFHGKHRKRRKHSFPGGRKGYCSGIDAGSSEGFITSGRKKNSVGHIELRPPKMEKA